MGTGSFPGVKNGRGVTLTTNTLQVPWSWKGRSIPLLPLWAVRPVQSLSACTRVTFIFTFILMLLCLLWNPSYKQLHKNCLPVRTVSLMRPFRTLPPCALRSLKSLYSPIYSLPTTRYFTNKIILSDYLPCW